MWQIIAGSSARPLGLNRAMRRSAVIAVGILALLWGAPAFAQNGGCPGSASLKNFQIDPNVGATFLISTTNTTNDTATYYLTSPDESSSGGIPGLIEYCVYPSQPPGNPTSASASYFIFDTTSQTDLYWNVVFGSVQGYFSFKRYDGDPSNIPFDGTQDVQVGTAIWSSAASPTGAPGTQTILLHVNDPDECTLLYGTGTLTCFVLPGLENGPPVVQLCNGAPACKDVVIDEAITTTPLTVPGETLLHIHYTYAINNPVTNTFNMLFLPPAPKTNDVNSGGGKDYFGCEQIPDPHGAPGAWGTYPSPSNSSGYQGTKFGLNFTSGTGNGCPQSRFFLQAVSASSGGAGPITLAPGDTITFTVDMETRVNKGGKLPQNQEYTSCGLHLLNSGFTVKWFEYTGALTSAILRNPGTLYSYSTNINPIYVNVVSGNKLVCPTS
jgi:hypothetical protein